MLYNEAMTNTTTTTYPEHTERALASRHRVYALWHGGSGYALGDTDEYLEVFASLRDAFQAFRYRHDRGYSWRCTFNFVSDEHKDDTPVFCPCVEEDSEMMVWFHDPREMHDPYPDRLIKFGPRGGVNIEYC